MNNKKYEQLKLFKKIYDNSFYPAMYNIEKNCVEYPPIHNSMIFYFDNIDMGKLIAQSITETGCKELRKLIKRMNYENNIRTIK